MRHDSTAGIAALTLALIGSPSLATDGGLSAHSLPAGERATQPAGTLAGKLARKLDGAAASVDPSVIPARGPVVIKVLTHDEDSSLGTTKGAATWQVWANKEGFLSAPAVPLACFTHEPSTEEVSSAIARAMQEKILRTDLTIPGISAQELAILGAGMLIASGAVSRRRRG